MFETRTSSNWDPSGVIHNGQRLKLPITRNEFHTGLRQITNLVSHEYYKQEMRNMHLESSESDESGDFEKPIPYEAIIAYPKDRPPKKISPDKISGVRYGYVIIIALLSLVLIVIGGIFKNDCNFRMIPYLLIIGGLLGLTFSLVESWSSVRSFQKTLLLTMGLTTVYAITGMQVLLVYEPDFYIQSSERYCNKVFYTSALFLIVFQTGVSFMLIVYILLLNATL